MFYSVRFPRAAWFPNPCTEPQRNWRTTTSNCGQKPSTRVPVSLKELRMRQGISCGDVTYHSCDVIIMYSVYTRLLSHLVQLLIEIIDASSVITWDFDVCKGDVVFNIYHSKRAPQPPRKEALASHGITSPGGNNVQLIDKSWQLGQDYSMVESPLTCKEGESVQVTPPLTSPPDGRFFTSALLILFQTDCLSVSVYYSSIYLTAF